MFKLTISWCKWGTVKTMEQSMCPSKTSFVFFNAILLTEVWEPPHPISPFPSSQIPKQVNWYQTPVCKNKPQIIHCFRMREVQCWSWIPQLRWNVSERLQHCLQLVSLDVAQSTENKQSPEELISHFLPLTVFVLLLLLTLCTLAPSQTVSRRNNLYPISRNISISCSAFASCWFL